MKNLIADKLYLVDFAAFFWATYCIRGIVISGLFGGILTLLKLCKIIDWSWWWIMAPSYSWTLIGVILAVAIRLVTKLGLDHV